MLVENSGYGDDMRVDMESRSLHNAGYAVTVIGPSGRSRRFFENDNGIRVYRYPRPWNFGGLIGYLWEYSYSLVVTFALSLWVWMRHGFDVVHSRVPPDVYVILNLFFKLFGKHYVADLQDSSPDLYQAQHDGRANRFVHGLLLSLERWSCRTADCLITINESYRKMLIDRTGMRPESCFVVRNAPDPRFLLPIEPLAELRESRRTVIGYMGIIGVQDRVDVMLDALHWLRSDRGRDDFRAVIVGAGPALGAIQRKCTQLDLDGRVRFTGYLRGDDLFRHVASFDIGITPDPSNAYNDYCSYLKTMEYMAVGKPVVCFDLPESRLTAESAALYARPNDVRDLARQIERLMDDAGLRAQLGAVGRRRAETILGWGHQEQVLLSAYHAMLGGAGATVRQKANMTSPIGKTSAPLDVVRYR
jgi:glycosyltransferase involved in cell wall biosynthesis